MQPIYLLADSQLLFAHHGGPQLMQSMRTRIAAAHPAAAYIGAANGDNPAFYTIFEAAMEMAGIRDCRMIASKFCEEDEEYLRSADIVLLAGGDVERGWRTLQSSGMREVIAERYLDGIIPIGVSAGAVLLGQRGWPDDDPEADQLFETLSLVPCIVDAHDEARDWRRLQKAVRLVGAPARAIALPAGSGVIYHPDETFEPIRRPVSEFVHWEEETTRTLLMPGLRPGI